MENLLGGNADGGLNLGNNPLEQWFFEMPPCTRYWTVATVVTSVLLQCKVISPLQLFYTFRAVYFKSQYHRLLTTFTYFGPPSLDLLFHLFFMTRYSRLLESSSSLPTYSYLLLYATTSLLLLTSLTPISTSGFLGPSLSQTLVYIWSRRNPDTRLAFLGLLVFNAPYLPWVLMGFSLCMHGSIPRDEILGVVVGHVWYFFSDVWPGVFGGRPMEPPGWWVRLFEGRVRTERTEVRDVGQEVNVVGNRVGEVR